MKIDVSVILSEDVPEEAANALALVALIEAVCGRARAMGITRAELIERIPNVICCSMG